MKRIAVLCLTIAALACSQKPAGPVSPVEPLAPPAPGEGFQLEFHAKALAHAETWKCWIFDELPTDEIVVNINSAKHRQNYAMHHMDLMTLIFANIQLEPGEYDCADLYDPVTREAIMTDGVFLYASQQEEDSVKLPEGIVAQVPSKSPWLFEMHYVNTTDEDVHLTTYINAYTIPKDDVEGTIYGGAVRDREINVPPGAQEYDEWTRCAFTEDVDVLFLSSHTHELARDFQIFFYDGLETTSQPIYQNLDWQNPVLQNFDPPLHVNAGQGFEFHCIYDSNRTEMTHWGLNAEDEMCQIGVVFTPGDPSTRCEQIASSDGVLNNPQ